MIEIPFIQKALTYCLRPQTLNDAVDRLNYIVTACVIGFFAALVSAKQYMGTPIQCWIPKEWSNGWEEYAEDYCFIQSTYYIPMDQTMSNNLDSRYENEVSYYQWVPIVLAIQAIMFYLPNVFWQMLHNLSGIDIQAVVDDSTKLTAMTCVQRKNEVMRISAYIAESLGFSDCAPRTKMPMFRHNAGLGSFTTMVYCSIKILFLINVVVQFSILNSFLDHEGGWTWGFESLTNLWYDVEWHTSGMFPRVTMCDFKIRDIGQIRNHTIQCVLMINMFNEKIYLFLWFWLLTLGIVTFLNLIYVVVNFVFASRRERTVFRLLRGHPYDIFSHVQIVKTFTHDALKHDGILVLRFIERHAGALVTKDIAHKLFQDYLANPLYSGDGSTTFVKSFLPGLGSTDGKNEATSSSTSEV